MQSQNIPDVLNGLEKVKKELVSVRQKLTNRGKPLDEIQEIMYSREFSDSSFPKPNCEELGIDPAIFGYEYNLSNHINKIKPLFTDDEYNKAIESGESSRSAASKLFGKSAEPEQNKKPERIHQYLPKYALDFSVDNPEIVESHDYKEWVRQTENFKKTEEEIKENIIKRFNEKFPTREYKIGSSFRHAHDRLFNLIYPEWYLNETTEELVVSQNKFEQKVKYYLAALAIPIESYPYNRWIARVEEAFNIHFDITNSVQIAKLLAPVVNNYFTTNRSDIGWENLTLEEICDKIGIKFDDPELKNKLEAFIRSKKISSQTKFKESADKKFTEDLNIQMEYQEKVKFMLELIDIGIMQLESVQVSEELYNRLIEVEKAIDKTESSKEMTKLLAGLYIIAQHLDRRDQLVNLLHNVAYMYENVPGIFDTFFSSIVSICSGVDIDAFTLDLHDFSIDNPILQQILTRNPIAKFSGDIKLVFKPENLGRGERNGYEKDIKLFNTLVDKFLEMREQVGQVEDLIKCFNSVKPADTSDEVLGEQIKSCKFIFEKLLMRFSSVEYEIDDDEIY